MPIVIAFDLGSREAGCVVINPEDIMDGRYNIYSATTWKAPKDHDMLFPLDLWQWLGSSLNWSGDVVMAFERPYHRWPTAVRRLERVVGLLIGATLARERIDRIMEISAAKAKLALAGKGNADKDAMMAAAEAQFPMGWGRKWGEHEADALGVALACATELKERAWLSGNAEPAT